MEFGSYLRSTLLWLSSVIVMMALLPRTAIADVIAVTRKNVSYTFPSMPSNFGDRLPMSGFEGKLVVAVPLNGCRPLQHPPRINASSEMISFNYFALIRRDDCNFDLKVWNAQKVGYAGAIVYNIDSDDSVLAMNGDEYGRDVYIPSVFVGASSGAALKNQNYTSGAKVTLTPTLSFPVSYFLFPFVIVTSTCLVFFGIYMVAKYVRDRRRLKRSRLSRTNLKKIPIKKFVKGDDYDVCAICLDDYEEGDKLRILPCNHAFHCKCVDPWLTNNRRTCPVCKRKVVPSGEADSDDSDSDDDSTASPTEHTPLLAGGSNNRGAGTENTTAASSPEVDGAWGGEERSPVTLVDASTAMTENDSDGNNDDDGNLLSSSPITELSLIVGLAPPILAKPTLHAVPDDLHEAAVNHGLVDDIVPTVVVVENACPQAKKDSKDIEV